MQGIQEQPIISRKLLQVKQLAQSDSPAFELCNNNSSPQSPPRTRYHIQIGKLKRNHRMSNPQHLDGSVLDMDNHKSRRKKKHQNGKGIFSFFPTYTTMEKVPKQFGQDIIFDHNQSQLRQRKLNYIRDQERIIYQRKKLAPLRKKFHKDKTFTSKQGEPSFLSVEKVNITPIYFNSNEVSLIQTSSIFSKRSINNAKLSFDEKTRTLEEKLTGQSFYKPEIFKKIVQPKKFKVPFERYYYQDMIWKIGFTNKIKVEFPESYQKKFKVFIGKGNNSALIKTIIKRRSAWWSITDKIEQANFVWTQLKNNQIFQNQESFQPLYYDLIENPEKKKKNIEYKKNKKLMNEQDIKVWLKYYEKNKQIEQKMGSSFQKRNRFFTVQKKLLILGEKRVHNHLPQNYILGNKKALFYTMTQYYNAVNQDPYEYIPLTFHIRSGIDDPQFAKFLKRYFEKMRSINKSEVEGCKGIKEKNIWILKPGQYSNRGNGIRVCFNIEEIKKILKKKEKYENGTNKTYIIQSYIDRPFLYWRRKFDIRHFMMITSINGNLKGYWYEQGYIRTTSYEYTLKNNLTSVHLTNDAVQKNLAEYGKYEKGNKISYEKFQKYLQKQFNGKFSFFQTIYPQMKKIAIDSMRASSGLIDPKRKGHNFQIFGFDFMVDSEFHPWLIEINTNPCLQLSCPLLTEIIPPMIENAFRISVDPIFPCPSNFNEKRPKFNDNAFEQNHFELVFDSSIEEKTLKQIYEIEKEIELDCKELEKDTDEIFEDDGIELQDE